MVVISTDPPSEINPSQHTQTHPHMHIQAGNIQSEKHTNVVCLIHISWRSTGKKTTFDPLFDFMHVHESFNKTPPSWLRRPQNSGAHQSRTTSGDKCYHSEFGALWVKPTDLMPPSTKMPALDPDDRVENA